MILNDFNFGSTRLARFELPVIIERIISTYMSVKLQTIYKKNQSYPKISIQLLSSGILHRANSVET